MARRRMTVRRIDPWSVLKFGFIANLCLLAIGLICFGVVWYAIQRIGVIEQACDVARGVGFEECGIDGGNLFRWALLLGLLGVVIQTGLMVFFAFLHNLIADMVGGITVTLSEEGAAARDVVTARNAPTVSMPGGVPSTPGAPGAVPPLPPPQPAPALRTDPRHAPRHDAPQQPVGAPAPVAPVWPWERDNATAPVAPRPAPPAQPPPSRREAPSPPRREAQRPAAASRPAPPERPPTPPPPRPAAPERRPAAPARAAQRTDEQLFGPRPGKDD